MNKKIFCIVFICSVFTHFIHSQNKPTKEDQNKEEKDKTENRIAELRNSLNINFSKIVTGNSFSNFGNYATVTTTDESLKFSASLLLKKGKVINLNASGGAIEGVSAFFNQGKLNSNIKLGISYHSIIKPFDGNSFAWDALARDGLTKERQKIEDDYNLAEIANNFQKDLIDAKSLLYKLLDDSINIDKKIVELKKSLAREKEIQKQERLTNSLDSILFEREKNICLINTKKSHINNTDWENYFNEQFLNNTNKKYAALEDYEKKILALPAESIDVKWFSIGYNLNKDDFKFFDATLDFDNQISNIDYTSHELNLAFSRYSWRSYDPYDFYWSFGANISYTNNLSSLKSQEIIDKEEISSNPVREVSKTQKVFSGDYEEDLQLLTLFFDYYQFFGTGNNEESAFAFHLNPKVKLIDGVKNSVSIQFGFMIPFINTKDKSSIVNLEIFYKFNDVFENTEGVNTLIKKDIIGIQASFPLNFFISKNK